LATLNKYILFLHC